MKIRKRYAVVIAALLTATACGAQAYAVGHSTPADTVGSSGEWRQPGGNYASTRYSTLEQINRKNVKNLNVSWTMSTGTNRGLEGQPLVIGNTMYMVSSYPNYVYAIALGGDRGVMKWKYVPPDQAAHPIEAGKTDAERTACCDKVNRGAAYSGGKIFFNTLNGFLTALDAKTGRLLWRQRNADPRIAQTITAAPLVVHHNVITGMSGGEFGVRGYLTAYNENTGKRVWRAYSTGPDKDILIGAGFTGPKNAGLKTWPKDEWKRGGSAPWGWMSYDPKLNLVYSTTGNPGTWNPSQRLVTGDKDGLLSDNKWSMSVIARNPDTGMAKWAFQFNPFDEWDYDSTQEVILVDMKVKGKMTPVMVHFDKDGYAFVLDRRNGHVITVHPYVKNITTFKGFDYKTGRLRLNPAKITTTEGKNVKGVCPFAQGAKDIQPASYNAKTGLFYVPTNNGCMDYRPFHVKYRPGYPYVGAIVRFYEGPGGYGGTFAAFDALTGKTSFSVKESWPVWSGVLTTAGGVAYYGTLDGWFKAVNDTTGKVLWKFQMPSGVIGAPITYTSQGKQYIAVFAGVGGWPAEYIGNKDFGETDDLGAVNYYRYGNCLRANNRCKPGLQTQVNLGGDLMVFRVK